MASLGVFHPRVLRGCWFIRRATSFSSVWLMVLRSVPLGKNWRELSVGLLVRAALPRCVRITEPARQFRVAGHLAAAVVGHAFAQHGGQALHLASKSFQRRVGGAAAHFAENEIAGLAFDHRAHGRAVEGTLDQVSLPVTGHQTALDLFGPVDDPQRFWGDRFTRQRCPPQAPRRFVLSQGGDHFGFQPALWLRVNRGIDRLPLGISLCDTLPVNAWLIRRVGSSGCMDLSLHAICSGDQRRSINLPRTKL